MLIVFFRSNLVYGICGGFFVLFCFLVSEKI